MKSCALWRNKDAFQNTLSLWRNLGVFWYIADWWTLGIKVTYLHGGMVDLVKLLSKRDWIGLVQQLNGVNYFHTPRWGTFMHHT